MKCALAVVVAACSGRAPSASQNGSGSGSAIGSDAAVASRQLHAVAKLGGTPTLLDGSGQAALRFYDHPAWFQLSTRDLVALPHVGDPVAAQVEAIGGDPLLVDVLLGVGPIVSGGEHHHEQHVRVGPPARAVAIEGAIMQIGRFGSVGVDEVWRYEHEVARRVATIAPDGTIVQRPFARQGPDVVAASPVSAKRCAEPAAIDLSSSGMFVAVLVVECHADAPIRVATFHTFGHGQPITVVEEAIGSRTQLGFDPVVIAIAIGGSRRLAGRQPDGTLVLGRIDGVGHVDVVRGPIVGDVKRAVIASDATLWTLAGTRLYRETSEVPLRSPDGEPLAATQLVFDTSVGVVVLAAGKRDKWLFVERWTGPAMPRTLP